MNVGTSMPTEPDETVDAMIRRRQGDRHTALLFGDERWTWDEHARGSASRVAFALDRRRPGPFRIGYLLVDRVIDERAGARTLDVPRSRQRQLAGRQPLDAGTDVAILRGETRHPQRRRFDHVVVDTHDPRPLGGGCGCVLGCHCRLHLSRPNVRSDQSCQSTRSEQRPAPGARANLFGMTETFGPYCGARADVDLPPDKPGSCGQPFDGVEIRVVDPETRTVMRVGEIGEICVRGRNVMRGICGRTRDATFDADGFYATGDLGRLDADGYLWYHGRRDDMFKVKGATVYPSEVEAALRAIDGVRQAHVAEIPGDADAIGALVVAGLSLDELATAARARLSAFKVPTRWVVTDSAGEVPMSPTAKVDKSALQELLQRSGRPTPRVTRDMREETVQ